ncbi:ribosome recycling factor-domain-containing protein [Phycomyces nitens]|nr:ribosome recycling factor-domain-containing protein [Phycomyces nitens]
MAYSARVLRLCLARNSATIALASRRQTPLAMRIPNTFPTTPIATMALRGYAKKAGGKKKGAAVEKEEETSVDLLFDQKQLDERMSNANSGLKEQLTNIRIGRANPAMLDSVRVRIETESYSLRDLAQVTIRDSQTLVVTVHDTDYLSAVEKSIRESGLNLNPLVDNKILRVPIPKPTKESRDKMAKLVVQAGEQAKAKIRSLRQDGMKQLKQDSKSQSSDDTKKLEKLVQTLTDKYNKSIDELIKAKVKDIQS